MIPLISFSACHGCLCNVFLYNFFHNKPCICSCSKEPSVVCSGGVSWTLLKASQKNYCVVDKVMSPVVQNCSYVFYFALQATRGVAEITRLLRNGFGQEH